MITLPMPGGRLPGLTIVLAILIVSGCREAPDPSAEPPVRPAKLHLVSAADTVRTVSLPAVIDALASAELAFQTSGPISALSVREGEAVAAGSEIARLDQRDFRTELAKAEASYRAAEGDYQRAEKLIARQAITRATFEQRETQRDLARATLDEARKRLDDSVLRAPFGGVVAELHVEEYQNVSPQQTVATLQSTGAAEALVQVPATLVAKSGQVELLETVVALDAAPDSPVPATFHSSATRADPASQTFEVRFTFTPPPGLRILPGMSGAVRATVAGLRDAAADIVIPIGAILSEADSRYVWVVDDSAMTVSRRAVTLGDGVGEMLPVLDGLEVGETIVSAGVSYLHEGMKIRRYEP